MKKSNPFYLFLLLFFAIISGCDSSDSDVAPEPEPKPVVEKWEDAADKSMVSLLRFWKSNGQYFTDGVEGTKDWFPYWYQPHALDVFIDAYHRKTDEKDKAIYKGYMLKWYTGVKERNRTHGGGSDFDNEFYDDMEWVALALLRGYHAIGEASFLESAKYLWGEVKNGWDEEFRGGIYWTTIPYGNNNDKKSKNACSNAPASLLALKMYEITKDESDLEWATKIYRWTKNYLYNPATGGVYDNIKVAPLSDRGKIDMVTLSYNQGTFLASALGLYQITKDEKYLEDAQHAANHTITSQIQTNTKLLRDEGEGGNALFRGIFIRYFTDLIQEQNLSEAVRKQYLESLELYATTILEKGAKPDEKGGYMYGRFWDKATSDYSLAQQLTGCMLIEARSKMQRIGLLD